MRAKGLNEFGKLERTAHLGSGDAPSLSAASPEKIARAVQYAVDFLRAAVLRNSRGKEKGKSISDVQSNAGGEGGGEGGVCREAADPKSSEEGGDAGSSKEMGESNGDDAFAKEGAVAETGGEGSGAKPGAYGNEGGTDANIFVCRILHVYGTHSWVAEANARIDAVNQLLDDGLQGATLLKTWVPREAKASARNRKRSSNVSPT